MLFFFFQAEDGIRDYKVTGVQTCALPISQFVWELEEEIGSPHFAEGLAKGNIGKPDSVVVSDTIWLAGGRPAAPYGLRGNLAVRLILETARREGHFGLTRGGAGKPPPGLGQPHRQICPPPDR